MNKNNKGLLATGRFAVARSPVYKVFLGVVIIIFIVFAAPDLFDTRNMRTAVYGVILAVMALIMVAEGFYSLIKQRRYKTYVKENTVPYTGQLLCSNCGRKLEEDFKYCPECGMKLPF